MNRSHTATLLITVFALAILGIAASTLHAAHPDATKEGSADPSEEFQTGQTSGRQAQSSGGQATHFAFPDVNVERGLNNRSVQSGDIIQRLVIGGILLLSGAILLIRRLTSNDNDPHSGADEATDPPINEHASDTPVVPASNPPPTNDVYRAWRAMIASLDWGDQETPAELAQKAIRAGHPETPVTELTALFCSVRYGGRPPTDEREQCAQHALDQIQQTEQSDDALGPER